MGYSGGYLYLRYQPRGSYPHTVDAPRLSLIAGR